MGYPKLTPATAAVHDLLTCDVDRQRLNRFDIGNKACRIEKDLHIPVAPSIQSSRTQRKTRQCIGPGLPIQLVLEFLPRGGLDNLLWKPEHAPIDLRWDEPLLRMARDCAMAMYAARMRAASSI